MRFWPTFVLLGVLVAGVGGDDCTCSGTTITVDDEKVCFEVLTSSGGSWSAADSKCAAVDGFLAHIESGDMIDQLKSYISENYQRPIMVGHVVGNGDYNLHAYMCPDNKYKCLVNQTVINETVNGWVTNQSCLFIEKSDYKLHYGLCVQSADVLCEIPMETNNRCGIMRTCNSDALAANSTTSKKSWTESYLDTSHTSSPRSDSSTKSKDSSDKTSNSTSKNVSKGDSATKSTSGVDIMANLDPVEESGSGEVNGTKSTSSARSATSRGRSDVSTVVAGATTLSTSDSRTTRTGSGSNATDGHSASDSRTTRTWSSSSEADDHFTSSNRTTSTYNNSSSGYHSGVTSSYGTRTGATQASRSTGRSNGTTADAVADVLGRNMAGFDDAFNPMDGLDGAKGTNGTNGTTTYDLQLRDSGVPFWVWILVAVLALALLIAALRVLLCCVCFVPCCVAWRSRRNDVVYIDKPPAQTVFIDRHRPQAVTDRGQPTMLYDVAVCETTTHDIMNPPQPYMSTIPLALVGMDEFGHSHAIERRFPGLPTTRTTLAGGRVEPLSDGPYGGEVASRAALVPPPVVDAPSAQMPSVADGIDDSAFNSHIPARTFDEPKDDQDAPRPFDRNGAARRPIRR